MFCFEQAVLDCCSCLCQCKWSLHTTGCEDVVFLFPLPYLL